MHFRHRFPRKSGVDDGARTHDRRNHNPELYQLSYVHHSSGRIFYPESRDFWQRSQGVRALPGRNQKKPLAKVALFEKWRARKDYSGHPALRPYGAAFARRRRSNSLPANLSNLNRFEPPCESHFSNGREGRLKNGAPGRIRTSDLLVRSQTLYPTELRAHARLRIIRSTYCLVNR